MPCTCRIPFITQTLPVLLLHIKTSSTSHDNLLKTLTFTLLLCCGVGFFLPFTHPRPLRALPLPEFFCSNPGGRFHSFCGAKHDDGRWWLFFSWRAWQGHVHPAVPQCAQQVGWSCSLRGGRNNPVAALHGKTIGNPTRLSISLFCLERGTGVSVGILRG